MGWGPTVRALLFYCGLVEGVGASSPVFPFPRETGGIRRSASFTAPLISMNSSVAGQVWGLETEIVLTTRPLAVR
jgi:hypothetical protein